MNRILRPFALLSLCLLAMLPAALRAQTTSPIETSIANSNDKSSEELYQDANGYLGRRYQEFNKQNLPYDPQLEIKTRQEQRELALKYTGIIQSRKSLKDDDVYFLGLLQHLANEGDAALDTMRRFLKSDPDGEKPQIARNIVVLYAVKKDLLSEAETTVETYSHHQPQNPEDRFKMEFLIADAFSRANKVQPMLEHSKRMYEAAQSFAATRKSEVFKRDELLLKAAIMLTDAYVKAQQKDAAVKTFEELRRVAMSLPSGTLYKQATARLALMNPAGDLRKLMNDTASLPKEPPPEIVATDWIDQQPKKLSDFRGQVVLLDFWAFWCGPCQYTFPNLERWHETYKNRGLVILGVTNYQGQVEGRKPTTVQELEYLRDFKKRNRLNYGFAIADTHANDFNYGVFSIPMSFLIDRKGVVRYISAGASDTEIVELGRMIKKVLDEPVAERTVTGRLQVQSQPPAASRSEH